MFNHLPSHGESGEHKYNVFLQTTRIGHTINRYRHFRGFYTETVSTKWYIINMNKLTETPPSGWSQFDQVVTL